jgi:S-adenosylmethionine synthetase
MIGYAPLSETERIVLNTERWLNSRETKQRLPVIGQDIKLMAVRNSKELSLTTAIAFVDQHVSSVQDYFAHKEAITSEILKHVESQLETIAAVNVQLNTLDDRQLGKSGIYLTVTGTSVECGDSGQVGRGNNVRGLISLNRPVSNEAAAGKNPVSHVGKIYNLLSYEIADRIYESVGGVEEVYVWLVSQIGRPISQPWLASASVRLKSDGLLSDVEAEIQKVFQHQLDGIAGFCERLIGGNTIVC